MSTNKTKIGTLLAIGILSFVVGLAVTLLPLHTPSLAIHTLFVCYWIGGALMILGGLFADVSLICMVARLLANFRGAGRV